MDTELSYLCQARNVKLMKVLGVYPIVCETSKKKKILSRIYGFIVLLMVIIYTVQQIVKVYKERDNAAKVMATMFLFLANTDFLYKFVVLWTKSDQIEEILQITKGPIFNQGEIAHRIPLQKTVREGLFVVGSFNYISLFTCFLWTLQPTIQHIQNKPIELPIWLPFDTNLNPQLDLVRLLERSKVQEKDEMSISFSEILEIRLKNIIIHHNEVLKMSNKVQAIFGNVIFYFFLDVGWILCTSAYRLVVVNPASVEFVSMAFFIICILIELFLYCYYGNEITYESGMLMQSAYAADWLAFPVKLRRTLIIFMERIKNPIRPMAGSLVPLSKSSFVSIVRSSYTFYAFLKESS